MIIKCYCEEHNFAEVPPLCHLAEASELALPKLQPIRKLIKASMQELPVEVPLPSKFKSHNIFVCPVAKEACT